MEKRTTHPSAKQRIPSLDGIRALCILMVLGAHAAHTDGFPQEWLGAIPYLINGSLGVQVFFVLSGFVIAYLLAREGQVFGAISLSEFYIRRVLRIFPVYYCFFFVFLSLTLLTGKGPSLCQSVTILTFTKNYGCGSWLDGHLWSLSVEVRIPEETGH